VQRRVTRRVGGSLRLRSQSIPVADLTSISLMQLDNDLRVEVMTAALSVSRVVIEGEDEDD